MADHLRQRDPRVSFPRWAIILFAVLGTTLVAVLIALVVAWMMRGAGSKQEARAYPPSRTRFQGRTAEAWGDQALDVDAGEVNEAAAALQQLRSEGIPYLLTAIRAHAKAGRDLNIANCVASVDGNLLLNEEDAELFGQFLDAKYAPYDTDLGWNIRAHALLVIKGAGRKARSLLPKVNAVTGNPRINKLATETAAAIR